MDNVVLVQLEDRHAARMVDDELRAGLTTALQAGTLVRRIEQLAGVEPSFEVQACRECGCTADAACVDVDGFPCSWVEDDLCSACAPHDTAPSLIMPGWSS